MDPFASRLKERSSDGFATNIRRRPAAIGTAPAFGGVPETRVPVPELCEDLLRVRLPSCKSVKQRLSAAQVMYLSWYDPGACLGFDA